MRTSVAFAAVFLAASVALPAASLTIDNFEEGGFTVVDLPTPAPTLGEQSGLLGTNVVGGVRLVEVLASSGGTATAALTPTAAPDDGALLSFTDTAAPIGTGRVEFIYDGIPGSAIDGINGALNLDLSALTTVDVLASAIGVTADAQLTLWSSTTVQNSPLTPLANGITSFSLASFGAIDLTNVRSVRLTISGLDPVGAPTIYNISAVPEPVTGLLVAAGLVGMAIHRRTRSN